MSRRKLAISEWGPSFWHALHAVAFTMADPADDDARRRSLAFVRAFADVLPCPSCREHFQQLIADDLRAGHRAPALESRDAFARTTVAWHNAVNERLGKPVRAYDEVYAEYVIGPPEEAASDADGGWGGGRGLDPSVAGVAIALVAIVALAVVSRRRAGRGRGGEA
jgi:hypothetical protein